jgi:hypothetical protein
MEKSNGKFSIGPTVTSSQPKTLAIAKIPVNIKSPFRTPLSATSNSNNIDIVTSFPSE